MKISNKKNFVELFSSWSNEELVIAATVRKDDYVQEAITAIQQILRKRGLTDGRIEEIRLRYIEKDLSKKKAVVQKRKKYLLNTAIVGVALLVGVFFLSLYARQDVISRKKTEILREKIQSFLNSQDRLVDMAYAEGELPIENGQIRGKVAIVKPGAGDYVNMSRLHAELPHTIRAATFDELLTIIVLYETYREVGKYARVLPDGTRKPTDIKGHQKCYRVVFIDRTIPAVLGSKTICGSAPPKEKAFDQDDGFQQRERLRFQVSGTFGSDPIRKVKDYLSHSMDGKAF